MLITQIKFFDLNRDIWLEPELSCFSKVWVKKTTRNQPKPYENMEIVLRMNIDDYFQLVKLSIYSIINWHSSKVCPKFVTYLENMSLIFGINFLDFYAIMCQPEEVLCHFFCCCSTIWCRIVIFSNSNVTVFSRSWNLNWGSF